MKLNTPHFQILFLCIMVFVVAARAQHDENAIIINVTQAQSPETFLNGYRASVSGQTITYHSSHPDAEVALIARARREVSIIAWETDTLVAPSQGEFYQFVWLAGLEHAGWGNTKVSHKFDFLINGQRWFTFENRKDSTAQKWMISGKNGAVLSFEALTVDKFGDLFGHMFLKVSKKDFPSGRPLTLQVVGEEAESVEWYMTFQYRFDFTPRLRAEPALMRKQNQITQTLRLSLDNLQNGRTIEIVSPNQTPIRQSLNIGANIFMLPIPVVEAEKEIPVVFKLNNKLVRREMVKIKPVARRDIYLLSYTHNDIGYTDLQPNVERKQWSHLEEALRLIQATRDYPPEARYKWNIEILWPLESYLRQASEQKRQEVIAAVRNGSIGLNALYVNPLTGLTNAVEMSHFTEYARRLAQEYSLPITTAQVSDIPGFTWGLVSALAQSGVKYFASAPNSFDRVGHVYIWGDKPFYWTSQSGAENVLMWLANASYASFHEGTLDKLGDEKILKLMRQLDEKNYPYDIVHLPYTLGDNGGPDPNLSNFVRSWNERYAAPRLIIATHAQMFKDFEARYGATLPSIQGDFTPYWEDGAASTAKETAMSRNAANRLIQAEALWSMRSPENFPENEFYAAWRNVVLYDEHTWGAHNSISEPDLPFVTEQWRIKQNFAVAADSMSRAFLSKALPFSDKTPVAIEVYNTNSWPRTDIVLLSREQSGASDWVVDEKGNPVPSQRLVTGELAVLAENVAPMTAKRLWIKKGRAYHRGAVKVMAYTVENDLLALAINPQTGAIEKFLWKPNRIQLADTSHGLGLNQYLYIPGKNPDDARSLKNIKIKIQESGPLVASLLIEAEAPGCKSYTSEVRVIDGISRVDIINTIDKLAVREKEGVHIAFPFNVPNGQIRYDVANGIVRPEADQLNGACKNFFSVQSWADVSNADYGITWATIDAPLIEIGAITAEQPWLQALQPSPLIYSYAMNNYWHTNYKADQEGLVQFRYAIQPHAEFNPAQAAKFGRERRTPLLACIVDPAPTPMASLFQIEPPEVLVESIKPIENGRAWLLYFYNPTAQPQQVVLRWNKTIPATIYLSDSFATLGQQMLDKFEIKAHGSLYVRVNKND
jgi:alpha-mannosidase